LHTFLALFRQAINSATSLFVSSQLTRRSAGQLSRLVICTSQQLTIGDQQDNCLGDLQDNCHAEMSGCSYFPVNSILGECTPPYGTCNATTNLCTCLPNHSGRNDFIDGIHLDCNVYQPILKYWWGIVALMNFVACLVLTFLVVRFLRNNDNNIKKLVAHKQIRILLGFYIVCPVKMWEARRKWKLMAMIGDDWLVSILHCVSGLAWWLIVVPLLVKSWLKIVISQSKFHGELKKRTSNVLKLDGKRIVFYRVGLFFAYAATMACCIVDEYKILIWLQAVYFLGHLLAAQWIFSVVSIPTLQAIYEIMGDSVSKNDPSIARKREKIRMFLIQGKMMNFAAQLIGFLMIFVPYGESPSGIQSSTPN